MKARAIAVAGGAVFGGGVAAIQASRIRLRRWERLDPATVEPPGALLSLDGVAIHYQDLGGTASPHATPILLVHGFAGSMVSFRRQMEPLARERRVLALDLPGFGYSDRSPDIDLSHTAQAERLRAFLDRLDVSLAVVLGHSMGGLIAMRFAAAHPDRVERLILVAGAPPDRRFRIPLYPLLRPFLPIPLALIAGERRVREELQRIVSDPSIVTDEMCRRYTEPLRLRGTSACLFALLSDIRHDQPFDPASIQAPTLLLWGDADPVVRLSAGRQLRMAIPNARLDVIPHAGHLVLEERPEESTEIIRRFLSDTTTDGHTQPL
jgi:pimeloyl-ACP methyl ester carboxylesterase